MLRLINNIEADQIGCTDVKKEHNFDIGCQVCRWRELCLPAFLSEDEIAALENVIVERRKVNANELIYQQGETFNAIFAILSGAVKDYKILHNGVVSVTGFHLPGELFGYSGIYQGCYSVNAEALQDTLICVVPYDGLTKVCHQIPELQARLFHLMSGQIVQQQEHLGQLKVANAARIRVAIFLLDLSSRSARRSESATRIRIPITQHDIGSYLGIASESVCRELTHLVKSGVVTKNKREITILDFESLRRSAGLVSGGGRTACGASLDRASRT